MIEHSGQQLGNYRLVNLLGKGGFAHVYLGEHIYLGTQAAIGHYKIVRAVTMTLVTLIGSIAVGFGIPLSPPFGELAALLSLIILPLLLQAYKGTTNYK